MTVANLSPRDPDALELVGQVANQYAARSIFADYQSRKSANTIKRQGAGLALFARYLRSAGVKGVGDLAADPLAWRGVTWGLVEGFVRWQLHQGYAVASVNVRLSTVKTYAGMAARAGAIPPDDYAMIRLVKGYSRKEGKELNEKREDAGLPTRYERPGAKKAHALTLSKSQAKRLRAQPDTPQGRRDALMVGLMLDLGLRCGEVVLLTVSDLDTQTWELTFYRPKVDKTQTHRLTGKTLGAARAYVELDALAAGPLLRASRKDGSLLDTGVTERAITARVNALGKAVGLDKLSAHDLRHTWATMAARAGTPLDRLMDAGGWNSPAMPMRYIEAARIANEGVRLE